jgi:hypothetical protein
MRSGAHDVSHLADTSFIPQIPHAASAVIDTSSPMDLTGCEELCFITGFDLRRLSQLPADNKKETIPQEALPTVSAIRPSPIPQISHGVSGLILT